MYAEVDECPGARKRWCFDFKQVMDIHGSIVQHTRRASADFTLTVFRTTLEHLTQN